MSTRPVWFLAGVVTVGFFALIWLVASWDETGAGTAVATSTPARRVKPTATSAPPVIEVNIIYPTNTPRPTTVPMSTVTKSMDFCMAGITKAGETCILPPPTPLLPTPYPSCDQPEVNFGDRCRWPAPTPNVHPWTDGR